MASWRPATSCTDYVLESKTVTSICCNRSSTQTKTTRLLSISLKMNHPITKPLVLVAFAGTSPSKQIKELALTFRTVTSPTIRHLSLSNSAFVSFCVLLFLILLRFRINILTSLLLHALLILVNFFFDRYMLDTFIFSSTLSFPESQFQGSTSAFSSILMSPQPSHEKKVSL